MHSRITPRGGFVAIAALTLVASNISLLASGASPGSRSRPKDHSGASPSALDFALDDAPSLEADTQASLPEPQAASSTPAPASPKQADESPNLPAGSFETLENGYRRVYHSETITLSPEQVQNWHNAGKGDALAGNQHVFETFTDYLPENWMAGQNVAAGARVDSFGNPIVNITAGLPDWAQRDVDGLRHAIADTMLRINNLGLALDGQAAAIVEIPSRLNAATYTRGEEELQGDLLESQHVLGNYLGQAIARQINVADLVALEPAWLPTETLGATAGYLHFYEGVKRHEALLRDEPYQPTQYPTYVAALVQAAGYTMQAILALEADGADNVGLVGPPTTEDDGGIAGLFCGYQVFPFGVGMTAITGDTEIWNGGVNPVDDASVNVSLGFNTYFWPCDDNDINTMVRVSSNGYLSFYQQGGGALNGTEYINTVLPSATDPDGMAAGWWDDLEVLPQGGTDAVSYKTEGSVGNRTFTVQYTSISRHLGDTSEFHWFQIKIRENHLQVQFHYDTLWDADSIDNATTGIETFAGDDAQCAFNCGNNNSANPNSNFDFYYPQPSHDNCASAICIEEDESLVGNNFGADGTDITSCAFNDFADVWYRYRATATENITVSLCDTVDTDTTVAVFNACGGAQVACDDDFCGDFGPSQVTFAGTAGTTYSIRVAGWDGNRGSFRIEVNGGGAGGEVCSTCWPLAATDTFNGSTSSNTGCDDESSCATGDTIDEWFCWTAPFDGTARVTTCAPTTNFDTTLAVYHGTCTSPIGLGCNDDANLTGCDLGSNFYKSRVLWNVQGGTAYKVRLAGFDGDAGVYNLSISMWGCRADIAPTPQGDNVVDVDDLVAVILEWGPCSGCRADFEPPGGDGQVNVDDLVAVILNWGVCP
jgi:hypothetical protein